MMEDLKKYEELVWVGQSVWDRMLFFFFKNTLATMTAAIVLPIWVESKLCKTLSLLASQLVIQDTVILFNDSSSLSYSSLFRAIKP
jgi:hypothetical protein